MAPVPYREFQPGTCLDCPAELSDARSVPPGSLWVTLTRVTEDATGWPSGKWESGALTAVGVGNIAAAKMWPDTSPVSGKK